jgi:hypothetical protein
MSLDVRTRSARLGIAIGLALAGLACGCSKGAQEPPSTTSAAPSASAATAAARGPEPEPSAVPQPPVPAALCRVLRVTGEAKVGEVALVSGATLDGSDWFELGKGASLTLKHTSSGRELGVAGPALFRACRRGREQVLLARGKLASGLGMGARPGAEMLIATPVAVVRYGEAEFKLALDDKKLSLEMRAGQLELDSALPEKLKSPLRGNDKLSVPLGKPDPAALIERCKVAAQESEAAARRVALRGDPEPLGERAKRHVRARRAARAACTVAAASTGLVADPTARAGLWAEAARWEALWENILLRTREQAAEK